jgi:acetyl esterase/lipase
MFSFFYYYYLKLICTVIRRGALASGALITQADEKILIPSRDANRTIAANLYKSKGNNAKPTSLLINLHGSGFVLPFHGSDDEFARQVVAESDYAVLDVSYRLAPEYPHPAGLHDVEDAIKWAIQQREQFISSEISISGFSAGGNFALVASSAIFPKDTFQNVLAFYPVVDLVTDPHQKVAPDTSKPPLGASISNIFNNSYLPAPANRGGPTASPLFTAADQFQGNILIVTCACDNLCNEGEELAAKIKKASSKRVVQRRFDHVAHAFDKQYKPDSEEERAKEECYKLAIEFLRSSSVEV